MRSEEVAAQLSALEEEEKRKVAQLDAQFLAVRAAVAQRAAVCTHEKAREAVVVRHTEVTDLDRHDGVAIGNDEAVTWLRRAQHHASWR